MAITIDNAYISTFEDNVVHLAQQRRSKLRDYVRIEFKESKSHRFDRIGTLSAAAKAGARTATPQGDPAWSGRITAAATYDVGATVEPEDLAQMLINPVSAQAETLANAMNRQVDDIIIADAIGTALDEDGGNVAFTAGQTIGDGTGEISLDGILEVDELFYDNDVDPEERKCFVIGPKQRRKMFQLLEFTSKDFQGDKAALATGHMQGVMGYDWIVSTRLNVPSANELDCFVFTKNGIGLHISKDIWTRVAERPDESFNIQLYAAMTMDAVRIQDEHVVKYHVADTVS